MSSLSQNPLSSQASQFYFETRLHCRTKKVRSESQKANLFDAGRDCLEIVLHFLLLDTTHSSDSESGLTKDRNQ